VTANTAIHKGGLFLFYGGQVLASTISQNTAGESAGGIYAYDGLTLTNSTVSGNSADMAGGGLTLNRVGSITQSDTFENAVAQDFIQAGVGGGIALTGSTTGELTITDSRIMDNAVYGAGGGIHAIGPKLTLTDTEISGNLASGSAAGGGGVFAIGDVTLVQSQVTGNTVSGRSAGDAVGGGLFVGSKEEEPGPVTPEPTEPGGGTGTTVVAPTSAVTIGIGVLELGKVLASAGSQAIDGSLTVAGSTVSDNAVRGVNAFGGGIALADASANIVSSTISGNRVAAVEVGGGGGVFGAADFINATLHGNSAAGGAFAGAAVLTGTSSLLHSTITGNAAPDGESVYVQFGAATEIGNSILLGNGAAGDVAATDPAVLSNLGGNVLSTGAAALIGAANNVTGATPESVFNRLALLNVADEDVLTGELADNGGDVHTVALHTMGLARDAGLSLAIEDFLGLDGDNDLLENLPHDARGEGRAISILTGLAGLADAGAFEAQEPRPRFEGALLDGAETLILPSTAANGTTVFDVAATDGAGGAEDANIIYSITGGNPNIDGDGTLAFAIDPGRGVVSVADQGDLQADLLARAVDLKITALSGGISTTATLSILLDSPLWLSVLGPLPFISFLGRFNNLQAAFDAAPGGGLIPGGGTVRVDQSPSTPATALATVNSDNLLFYVADAIDSSFNLALAAGIQNLSHIGAGRVTISGNSEDNVLTGGYLSTILYGWAGNDTLVGREGDDFLIGGTGTDDMRGGPDDDFYGVDDPGDIVTELADEGIDTVSTALDDYHLPDHVEALILDTTVQRAFGNALNNRISVNFGDTTVQILDGGAGRDTMQGGFGDDIYIVDDPLDTVIEGIGEGDKDEVRASVSFDLLAQAAGVERLTLTGTMRIDGQGTDAANTMKGNGGANRIEGRDGGDTIFGGGGNDTLDGGTGDDWLRGDGGDDVLIGGGGLDTALFQGGIDTTVDLGTLAPQATGHGNDALVGIRNVTSGLGHDHLTGNSAANRLEGGGGNDIVLGGAGNDTLIGGGGHDLLRGDGGDDELHGGLGRDTAVFRARPPRPSISTSPEPRPRVTVPT
jgi:hypothetical protein